MLRSVADVARRDLERMIVRSALRILGLTLLIVVGALLAWRLRLILLLVLAAIFVAALLNPAVHALQRYRLPRTLAVLVVYVLLTVVIALVGYTLFHSIYFEATRFAKALPALVRQAQQGKGPVGHLITRFHLATYFSSHSATFTNYITRLGRPALEVGKTVLSGVTSIVTIGFVSLFMLLEAPSLMRVVLGWLSPERAVFARRTINAMSRQVTGFMLGNFLTSLIAGVVVFISLRVTGVPYAGVLALWTGLVDFLPLVGGLLAGVPTVGVAFLHSTFAGVVTVIVFLVYQQVENHILNPVIISRTVRLNPLWVLLAVLMGVEVGAIVGSTFGAICGAIFAVPAAGGVQVALHEVALERASRSLGIDDLGERQADD